MRQQQGGCLRKPGELPYTPIQFTFSETIGSKGSKSAPSSFYSNQYKDILTPKILNHHNPIFYLLFHTPTVYNWIRTIKSNQSRLLDSYIRTGANSKELQSPQGQLGLGLLKTSLADYVKKWEVVKLAYCHKVYIKRQIGGGDACTHLCKTQVYTHQIEYLPKTKTFIYPRITCKQCQTIYNFQCQTRQFSHYVVLSNPTEANLSLGKEKITYSVFFAMNEQLIYIRCANKVWYEVNATHKTVKPIGFSQINLRNMKIAAYSQPLQESSLLKIAQPLPNIQEQVSQHAQKAEMEIQAEEKQTEQKITNKKQSSNNQPIQKPKKSLKELKSKVNQVLLHDPSKEYIQSVSKLYIEPKVKDQYELGYDKGKLKKKKQKKEYIKPDFNQIYQQLKVNGPPANQPEKMGKKIKKNKNKNKIPELDDQ